MKPITGISQSALYRLAPKGSCTLTLNINSSMLGGNVFGGPVLCEQGNLNQCYQQGTKDSILVTFMQSSPLYTAFGVYLSTDNRPVSMLAQSTDDGAHWSYKLDS